MINASYRYYFVIGNMVQSQGAGRGMLSGINETGYTGLDLALGTALEDLAAQGGTTSTNAIETYHQSEWKTATFENFGNDSLTIGTRGGFNERVTDETNYLISLAPEFRKRLDDAGNTQPLRIIQTAIGGISAVNTPGVYDIAASSREQFQITNRLVLDIKAQDEAAGIQPYFIFFEGQGEGGYTIAEWNQWVTDLRALWGCDVPIISVTPTWDRPVLIADKETWVNNHTNVHYGFGANHTAFIDQVALSAGVDKNNPATWSEDGTHFTGDVQLHIGWTMADKVEELSSGFYY